MTLSTRDFILITSLQLAVPLWIERYADLSEHDMRLLTGSQKRPGVPNMCGVDLRDGPCPCSSLADIIGTHGDGVQGYGEGCAVTFNALAKAVAICSRWPGGVTVFGHHWCSSGHMGIPHGDEPCLEERARDHRDRREQRADVTPPVVDVHLPDEEVA